MSTTFDPTLAGVRARLASGVVPSDEIQAAHQRISTWNDPALFLHRSSNELPNYAGTGTAPLAGVAIAVKDNIDVAGMPTTAGCPSFAYQPNRDATTVANLRAAGAVVVGKTNLDQFATGLVGTRSPSGVPRNPCDPTRIPGGSSSGSGVAVAAGLVPVALGTDTAGSGRVPAAFNGIVGFKPTRGWLSTSGVVPAVRSLDCVSVFAHTVADAWSAVWLSAGFDATDPFSRRDPVLPLTGGALRIGVPSATDLMGIVDPQWWSSYSAVLDTLTSLGHTLVTIDFAPFRSAAESLYGGPWVAERTAAVGDFLDRMPSDADPTVAAIIRAGRHHDAVAAFKASYQLMELRRQAEQQWQAMDVLVLPTVSHHPTLAAVQADPIGVNAQLGRFTNFANLLDTCAVAVPAPRTSNGLPTGITLFAPAWHDRLLAWLGSTVQDRLGLSLGATGRPWATIDLASRLVLPPTDTMPLAVFGAHLRGQPLNHRLLALGGRYDRDIRTASQYRCLLVSGPRPGLVATNVDGAAIAGELWQLPAVGIGRLLSEIGQPLALGSVVLDDGQKVTGFVCAAGAEGEDITAHGSWRAYLAARR